MWSPQSLRISPERSKDSSLEPPVFKVQSLQMWVWPPTAPWRPPRQGNWRTLPFSHSTSLPTLPFLFFGMLRQGQLGLACLSNSPNMIILSAVRCRKSQRSAQMSTKLVGALRGNTTRNSERKMALWEGLWEGLGKPLKASENLPSRRPSQRQISLSEPLRPVAPNRVAPWTFSEEWAQNLWRVAWATRPEIGNLLSDLLLTYFRDFPETYFWATFWLLYISGLVAHAARHNTKLANNKRPTTRHSWN